METVELRNPAALSRLSHEPAEKMHVCVGGSSPDLGENFKKLGMLCGLEADAIRIGEEIPLECSSDDCLVVGADVLASQPSALGRLAGIKCVFVFGFRPCEAHASLIAALTNGVLSGCKKLGASETTLNVLGGPQYGTGPLRGVAFTHADDNDVVFTPGDPSQQLDVIVEGSGVPYFVSFKNSECRVFLFGGHKFCDVDGNFAPADSLKNWFAHLVPPVLFIRHAFQHRCWQAELQRACFIIDDPLLRPKYGFIDFSVLNEHIQSNAASMSLAFIPWNAKRSSPVTAKLFKESKNLLSLCVHGNDHTRGEFGIAEPMRLTTMCVQAIERMRRHQELSGVPFSNVMVFPQGIFSSAAMAALKASGFLAAVNTSPHACDKGSLRIRDMLQPALMCYGDFPLLSRHYPKDIADFALDLFFGKPAIMVEHHGYFRSGYSDMDRFMERINALDDDIKWSSIGNICETLHQQKADESGKVRVRFYGSVFRYKNNRSSRSVFIFELPERDEASLLGVEFNGAPVEFEKQAGFLRFEVSLSPGEGASIRVSRKLAPADSPRVKLGIRRRFKIWARRRLSEFRDNVVTRFKKN
jgi:hypothetical protein